MPTSADRSASRRTRRFAPLVGVVLAELLALSLVADVSARAVLDPLLHPWENARVLMFVLAAAAVVAARPVATLLDRPMPASPYAVAMLLAVVVGAGAVSIENAQSGLPTRWPDGTRSLAGLLASDDIGGSTPTIAAFVDLREVIDGTVVVPPDAQWTLFLVGLAELPVTVDAGYDPALGVNGEAVTATTRFRAEMSGGSRLVVVGTAERYRLFFDDDVVALIAESDE